MSKLGYMPWVIVILLYWAYNHEIMFTILCAVALALGIAVKIYNKRFYDNRDKIDTESVKKECKERRSKRKTSKK